MSVVEEKVDELKVLEPDYSIRYQAIGKDEHQHVFAQKPLSFFGKIELFSLLGATLSDALRSGDVTIGEILDRTDINALNTKTLSNTDVFVKAIAKIVEFSPEFLQSLYCIALNVSKGEREYVKELMEMPESEGGLSDDDGIGILDTFVEQNWEAMFDFFREKMMPLIQKVSSKAQDSASSKDLKATRPRTRKR